MKETGDQEGAGNRDQHAVTGPDDALAGTGRRTHAFQADDEEQRTDEPGALNVEGQCHHAPSFFLNMASIRSVTT